MCQRVTCYKRNPSPWLCHVTRSECHSRQSRSSVLVAKWDQIGKIQRKKGLSHAFHNSRRGGPLLLDQTLSSCHDLSYVQYARQKSTSYQHCDKLNGYAPCTFWWRKLWHTCRPWQKFNSLVKLCQQAEAVHRLTAAHHTIIFVGNHHVLYGTG